MNKKIHDRKHFLQKNVRPVEIIDTTLRDGVQSPLFDDTNKFFLSQKEKLDIVDALIRYGIRYIEVFSPIVSKQEQEDLQAVIKKRNLLEKETGKTCAIIAHVRCHPKDIEQAVRAGVDGLNLYMGTSMYSRTFNHGKTLKNIVTIAKPLLAETRKYYPHLLLRFSGEDAFRTKDEDLFSVYDQLSKYVDRFGLPDTVGIATPEIVKKKVTILRKRYPKIPLEGHFHNDRGISLINALTAIESGMQFINTSILGLAERSGITSLTALFLNLYVQNPKYLSGYEKSLSYPVNILLADMLNIQVPTTEPVSLTNRTHSAGVHTGAQLKGKSVYEAHPLAEFGVNESRLLLGPLSGSNIIHYYLKYILNYTIKDEQAIDITRDFKTRIYGIKSKQTPALILQKIAKKYKLPHIEKITSHAENL